MTKPRINGQPRDEGGRFRKATWQERVAAHAAFLESEILVSSGATEPPRTEYRGFPIIQFLFWLFALALIVMVVG